MDIHEIFENFAEYKKRVEGIDIVQEHEKLSKITEFNYDIYNFDFVKYFELRTGVMVTKMEMDYKEVLHCDAEPADSYTLITKQKLQNCWKIWNVQSRR